MQRAAEPINGREGETAALLSTGFFTLSLCGGGFAPRHLNRWMLLVLMLVSLAKSQYPVNI